MAQFVEANHVWQIFNRCEDGLGVRGTTEEVVELAALNTHSLRPTHRYRDPHSVQVRAFPNIKKTIPNIKKIIPNTKNIIQIQNTLTASDQPTSTVTPIPSRCAPSQISKRPSQI